MLSSWNHIQWRLFLGLSGLAIGFHLFLWGYDAPYLHGSRGDNLLTFLPLIKAHTDASLSFEFPRAIWKLGAGWDPFESGQMGLFYPFYHVANLLSRLLGRPLALLDISFVMHQVMLIAMIVSWMRGRPAKLLGCALVLVFAPAPFMLGINWHLYGIGHIWWIGMILYLDRAIHDGEGLPQWRTAGVFFVLQTFFFMATHPQIFVWGELFLFAWLIIFFTPLRRLVNAVVLVFLTGLPLVPALLYLKWVSTLAAPNMMALRNSAEAFMHFSQDVSVALSGLFLGNWRLSEDFILWSDQIDPAGIGLFFQPLMGLLLIIALLKRRFGVVALCLLCVMLLGARSFPILDVLAVGPLHGFRWTWKLAIFCSPLCCLMLLKLIDDRHKWLSWVLIAVGLVSLGVCMKARHFNLNATEKSILNRGLMSNLQETRECLSRLGVVEDSRLVQVGDHDIVQTKSLIAMSLMANTPLLLNRGTVHLYGPLERKEAAEGHLQLSVPWRIHIKTTEYLSQRLKIEEAFRYIGVTHLFTTDERTLIGAENVQSCTDSLGAKVSFWPLPGARLTPYPHPAARDVADNVTVLSDGTLWVQTQDEGIPQLNITRTVAWEKRAGGWMGYPQPMHPGWPLGTVLLLVFVFWVCWRWGVPQGDESQA